MPDATAAIKTERILQEFVGKSKPNIQEALAMHDYADIKEAIAIAKKAERLEAVQRQHRRGNQNAQSNEVLSQSPSNQSAPTNNDEIVQKIADMTKILEQVVSGTARVRFRSPEIQGPTSSSAHIASSHHISSESEQMRRKNRGISPHQMDNKSILRSKDVAQMDSEDEDRQSKRYSNEMRSKTPDGYYKATSGLLIPKPIAGQYLDKYVVPKITSQEQNQPGYSQDFRGREFQSRN